MPRQRVWNSAVASTSRAEWAGGALFHAEPFPIIVVDTCPTKGIAVNKKRLLFDVALVSVLGLAVLGSTVALSQRSDDYTFFDELIEVKTILSKRYVESPDEEKLRQGAIKGMVEALNDPYTMYVPPADKSDFNKDLTGEYVGIGAQVNAQDGWLTIVSPLEDSPAFRAGLMADDRVLEIDGKSTRDVRVDDCVKMLVGEPGTEVSLLIERKGERFPLRIMRDRIKTRSVKGFHRDEANAENWNYLIDPERRIAYIRMTQFTPGVADEVLAGLLSVGADKGQLKGLVLDLRFNPGGLLSEAEAVADLFLEEGVIVSTKGRAYPERVTRARKEGTLPFFPIAVLLNGQSASASEVLSGALVENNRAIVVGTRSYGKGSVQSVMELPSGNGSELKVTEQGYFLPSGRSINRKDSSPDWGVDPSEGYFVPMTDAEMVEMLEVRRREEVIRSAATTAPTASGDSGTERWSDPEWIVSALKDKQLAAAIRAVQLKITDGEWKPTGEKTRAGGTLALDELKKTVDFRDRLLRELDRVETRIEALEVASGDAGGQAEPRDLWDNAVVLKGGEVVIRDASGKIVATLSITGEDVERWLLDAAVEKKP